MHLNADELVDLAEGTRPEGSAPHLAACDQCRRQMRELRAMMASVAEVDLPEPSPLFWEHLSQRVHDAVASEQAPRRAWLDACWRGLLTPWSAVAAAMILVVAVFSSRLLSPTGPPRIGPAPAPPPSAVTVADAAPRDDLFSDAAADEDASLTLVASLTANLDLEAAGEAGLAQDGSAEHAVTHMNGDDLRELRRLLKEELARSGA
jgi:hypothetical protein